MDIQKQVILENDPDLKRMFEEIVPHKIEAAHFWERWRYHQYLSSKCDEPSKQSESPVNISMTNLKGSDPALNNNNNASDDWDSWD